MKAESSSSQPQCSVVSKGWDFYAARDLMQALLHNLTEIKVVGKLYIMYGGLIACCKKSALITQDPNYEGVQCILP